MLMIPALYYLRGENYFILREFVKSLDSSHINFDLQSIFKVEAVQLFYQKKLNEIQSVFNFIYQKEMIHRIVYNTNRIKNYQSDQEK